MSTTVGEPDYETASHQALITGIKQLLGITANGNDRERQIVRSLEMLTPDNLLLVLAVCVKAQELSLTGDHHIEYQRGPEEPALGEDCYEIRDLLYKGEPQSIYLLASSLDLMPATMSVRDALGAIRQVSYEMFDTSSKELLGAHLGVAHALPKDHRYTPELMLLVQTHPDKTGAIIAAYERTQGVPSHREVLTYHGA